MRTNVAKARHAALAILLVAWVWAGCDNGNPTEPLPGSKPVASVVIAPKYGVWTGTLKVGQAVELLAKPLASDGTELPAGPVTWASTDTAVASVVGGVLVARGVGSMEVRATIRGRTGAVQVVVSAEPASGEVATVAVSPGANVMEVGDSRQYTARAYTASGTEIPGLPVSWSTSAPQVASVTPGGVVVAHAGGYADVVATIGGKSAAVGLTVTAPEPVLAVIVSPFATSVYRGLYVQLRASVIGQGGGELEGREVTWSSENPSIALVGADGIVLGVAKGTARVRGTSGGVTGYATVEVRELPSGPVQLHDLRGTQELPVPYIQIGSTLWQDANGNARDAFLVVTGGTLRLDASAGTYEESFTVQTYLSGGAPGQSPVAVSTVSDRGRLLYDLFTGWPILESVVTPGLVHRAEPAGAGEWIVPQSVLETPGRRWLWVVR